MLIMLNAFNTATYRLLQWVPGGVKGKFFPPWARVEVYPPLLIELSSQAPGFFTWTRISQFLYFRQTTRTMHPWHQRDEEGLRDHTRSALWWAVPTNVKLIYSSLLGGCFGNAQMTSLPSVYSLLQFRIFKFASASSNKCS